MQSSPGLWQWLQDSGLSLAFTTYQTNRLFLVGCKPEGKLAVHERLFDKPMGLYAKGDSLYMATRYQIWQLENRLAAGETYQGADRLYVPCESKTTGDLNVHDVVLDKDGDILFINTDFSCLAKLRPGFSFEPVWQPPFIGNLKAEDRCHLNGLAMRGSQPAYATACSATDDPAGWRNHRHDGGVVIDIPANEIIATGLSMPHSPRWYQGKLWLLNSGSGEFGYLDMARPLDQRFVPVTFCPGFVRGLAFVGKLAVVGLSKLRSKTFGGLALETSLQARNQTSQCGLMVIDIDSGEIKHTLQIEGSVEELFDIVALPGVRQPRASGFQDDDIDRLVNYPGSNGIVVTKPTVQRPGIGASAPVAGLPRLNTVRPEPFGHAQDRPFDCAQDRLVEGQTTGQPIQYQRVYHLTSDNLAPYDAMTYPSLQQRWQHQPQRGELLGVSASVAGEMVGFAIAECLTLEQANRAELISLFVQPAYRRQGIGGTLIRQLQQLLGCALTVPEAGQ
jgi:uncharacterized protein (TIGR03032 family)